MPDDLAPRLAARTLELVNTASVSRDEQRIAALVADSLPPSLELRTHGDDALLATTPRRDARPLVVLAGHLDTVPPQDNLPGHVDETAVHGLGASDMKGGLAVMLELAGWAADHEEELALDLGFLFFPREELPAGENALPELFSAWPELQAADLAILLEPTDGAIQVGCLGHVHARLVIEGESAHSARPWLGVNAIERALERLAPVAAVEPRAVELDGLTFVEVLSLTAIHGGIAANVIPDRVEATLSYRYAPDRTPDEAERELHRLAGDVQVVGNSPPGRVVARAPLVERLRAAGRLALEPKQAWTNVADFTSRGVDAVNFGPGMTRTIHRPDERVEIEALARAFTTLRQFALGSV